jgi:hypothetical protein
MLLLEIRMTSVANKTEATAPHAPAAPLHLDIAWQTSAEQIIPILDLAETAGVNVLPLIPHAAAEPVAASCRCL